MAFNLPVQNYFSRTTGPAVYSRPACWPVITDVATEVQFLFCDLGDAACQIRTTFTRTSGSQNIVIDWGDATISTVTNNFSTDTTHTYTPGSGTPCPSLGYTTFKIRVYFTGTGVSVLHNCNIMSILIGGSNNSLQVCHVLEAYYGDSTQNATAINFYSPLGTPGISIYTDLQFIKCPATVSWTNYLTAFQQCYSLVKVIMPTSNPNNASFNQAFFYCHALLEVTFPSNVNITSFDNAFQNCYNLRSVTLPATMNSLTSMNLSFFFCYNLRSVTIPSINSLNSLSSTFQNCYQLEWVKFTSMPIVGSVSMTNTFNTCYNLQTVYFPATGTATSSYNFTATFYNSKQLKNIVFPSNINVSTFSQTFYDCSSLISCIFPTSISACTNFSNTFYNCISLLKITLPTGAPTAANNFDNTFYSCYKLQEIIIPPGYIFSSMNSTFVNCVSLKTFTWTPGVQNSLTSLLGAFFNCALLTSITMPTSMTALTSTGLNSTFSACVSLLSITLPSTLNTVTTLGSTFNSCRSLTSVTLPTSMSACTSFSSTFTNCYLITSIILPNTVGAVTTFNSAFGQCNSLKTCILPGAAQLSLVNDIYGMFAGCSDLVTLTNFDKIGSLTATPLIAGSNITNNRFKGGSAISFSGPLSILQLNGTNTKTDVQSVRLLNASAGQWTGSSPQINVSYTNMSTAQIVQLFTDMAAQGTQPTTKTINITSATGAAALTAADRLIVTSRNWTIIG
jgi:hypothetical protein